MSLGVDRELIIQTFEGGNEIALLENKELVEFHRDSYNSTLAVGDIFWARVKKLLPPLNAVFVDIGEGKEAFLHYTDLGESFSSLFPYFKSLVDGQSTKIEKWPSIPPLDKGGKVSDVFHPNDFVVVRVSKEPMNTKGARLSAEISLAGRFLVLTPFSNVSISKKITNHAERDRLKEIALKMTVPNLGVIIRTVAEGKSVKELHEDYLDLLEKWNNICKKISDSKGITKLFEEQSKSNTLLRDVLNDSFSKIHFNDIQAGNSIKEYIQKIAPDKLDILKFHSTRYLFEEFGLTPKIKSAFNKIIPLPSGGYIIIESTEALCVIDVNSGMHRAKKNGLEIDESILKINLEAAREIARQLRLRDIGGIIVIDFIDTKNQEIKDTIYEEMVTFMRPDKANHTILPLSKFCLMQITRSRKKPPEVVKTKEVCPSCNGTGKISSTILITDFLFNQLQSIVPANPTIEVSVHPFVYAYLREGYLSLWTKWQWKLKKRIKLTKNASLSINEYLFFDKEMNLIN